ncbi:MAG: DUF2911 domain-containing protein [Bacteroidota bacterium]
MITFSKIRFVSAAMMICCFMATHAFSQLVLPQPSPKASVMQVVGVTEVSVTYSSPAVKGRVVWGDLVPFDEVWRTGANSATEISFSTAVQLAGNTVKAGKYALFTIPGRDNWTIILNSNEGQWGSTNYKKELDVVRFTVRPGMSERMQERLNFAIELTGDERAEVVLRWEKMRISFGVSTDLKSLAMDNINQYFHNAKADWYPHHNAASYLLTQGGSTAEALRMATRAVELNPEHFMPHFTKARALAASGNITDALASARQSMAVGEAKTSEWFEMTRPEIEASIKGWVIPGGGVKKK